MVVNPPSVRAGHTADGIPATFDMSKVLCLKGGAHISQLVQSSTVVEFRATSPTCQVFVNRTKTPPT